jgi:hypothetical protein
MRALALLVLLFFAAPLSAIPSGAQNFVGPCPDFAGCTTWNCAERDPWVHMNARDLASREGRVMLAHESKHVSQATAKGCVAWNEAWHDRTGALTDWKIWQEAEAYCVSAQIAVQDHLFASLYAAIEVYGGVLVTYGYLGLTAYEAARRIGVFCHVDIRP